MISTYAAGTVTGTVSSEIFLSSPNIPGKFKLHLDLANMQIGDFIEVRRYKTTIEGGTSRVIDIQTFQDAPLTDLTIAESEPIWNSLTGTATPCRFSLKQTFGVARQYDWAVLLDDAVAPQITGRTLAVAADGSVTAAVSLPGTIDANVVQWRGSTPNVLISGTVDAFAHYANPVLVADKTGFSLLSPQVVDFIGNITGTITNVLNVINPVIAGLVTGTANIAAAVWDEPLTAGTHNVATSSGKRLRQLSSISQIDASVNDVGATTTGFDTTLTEVDNFYNDALLVFTSGALAGQARIISDFANANGHITFDEPLTSAPANGVTFTILSYHVHTLSQIAGAVWDEQIGLHLITGSTGEKLNTGGDVWSTYLPGTYVAGQAGHILASRMPTGTVIVGTNNDKTGYFLATPQVFDMVGNITGSVTGNLIGDVTGNILGTVAQILDLTAAAANKIADHVLRRNYANVRASADGDAISFRSLLGAIAKLVNKWSISGVTLTIKHEDDATTIGTQDLTATPGADPITAIDTN